MIRNDAIAAGRLPERSRISRAGLYFRAFLLACRFTMKHHSNALIRRMAPGWSPLATVRRQGLSG